MVVGSWAGLRSERNDRVLFAPVFRVAAREGSAQGKPPQFLIASTLIPTPERPVPPSAACLFVPLLFDTAEELRGLNCASLFFWSAKNHEADFEVRETRWDSCRSGSTYHVRGPRLEKLPHKKAPWFAARGYPWLTTLKMKKGAGASPLFSQLTPQTGYRVEVRSGHPGKPISYIDTIFMQTMGQLPPEMHIYSRQLKAQRLGRTL